MEDVAKLLALRLCQGLSYADTVESLREILAYLQHSPIRLPLGGHPTAPVQGWHPDGFLTIRLFKCPDVSLRLHIWPASIRSKEQPDWPVHRHSWHIRSRILYGTVTNELYDVKQSYSDNSYLLYYARVEDGRTGSLEATDMRVSCRRISYTDFNQGDEYSIAKDEYHDTYVKDGVFTATLALFTDPEDYIPTVVGEYGYEKVYARTRKTCDPVTFSSLIGELRQKLYADAVVK